MRIALFISLAVNLLLVGAFVGVALGEMRHQRERATTAVARMPNMRLVLEALPPERAAAVRTQVVDAWRNAKEERREARSARIEVMRAVGSEPYDPAAVGAAFGRMREADSRVAGRFHDVVTDAMKGMTLDERRQMLRRLAARRADVRRLRDAPEAERGEPTPPQP